MARFSMQIAGQVAEVRTLFESTKEYFRAYLTEAPADFTVTVSREELAAEQEAYLAEAKEEGFRVRYFTEPFLERSVIQRKFAEHLFDLDTLLFHGSAVAVDGQGYLFTARSGTGKSTHTRLWREVFGDRAVMINDDKPFLRFTDGGVLICGSPWSGKHGLDSNITVPLKGICILERGSENRIRPTSPAEATDMLRKQGYQPAAPEKHLKFLELTDRLAASTPLWYMECTKDSEAAILAHRAMSSAL